MIQSIPNRMTVAVVQIATGLGLMGASWTIAWTDGAPFRAHTFFPLWLGYILLVDGIAVLLTGSSLLHRLGRQSIALFLVSIPFWWLFELANLRLNNWRYLLPHHYSWLAYHLEASIAFSTVVPAVFVSAELASLLLPIEMHWRSFNPGRAWTAIIGLSGFAMVIVALIWPARFFPLVWIGAFFATDWIGARIGAKSLSGQVRAGKWRPALVLFAGTLWCGFLWEMWNSHSMPKWTYDLPYAQWLRVFEMPVLGFGGYLPFGLSLYASTMLIDRLFGLGIYRSTLFDRD